MCSGHRNPIHCILPPHILEGMAKEAGDEQRRAAIDTLSLDHSIRAARVQNSIRRGMTLQADALAFATPGQPNRTIRDAKHTQNPNGKIVRAEGDPATGDKATDEAYDGLGDTYSFYWDVFHRDSIDGAGLPLNGVVHYGQNYDNAFWDGTRMVFGDGDGQVFNRFTISKDVIGHELTHGVTEDEAKLVYFGQPGALNESVSDVFGSMVKQHALGQTADQADWLIGEGLLAEGINGVALRSMKAPGTAYDDPQLGGKDPQPADMAHFVHTAQDNGGVHINSGIPNHAFYLLATNLGGPSATKAGAIWFNTLVDPAITPLCRFRKWASTTVRVATTLFGSHEAQATRDAWAQVGLKV
jgi:Zn-dependent metalloprotease